jgi:hypothetical protein
MNEQGEPGKPGERGQGQAGGRGGEGGKGGVGQPTGAGGRGGGGGVGAPGVSGPRGVRGASGNLGGILTIGIAIALISLIPSLLGLACVERNYAQDRQDRRIARYTLCIELERVKRANRAEAWFDFNNLPRTARILNIPVTPTLREIARENRDRTRNANKQIGGYGRTMREACISYARLELKTFPPPPEEELNGG